MKWVRIDPEDPSTLPTEAARPKDGRWPVVLVRHRRQNEKRTTYAVWDVVVLRELPSAATHWCRIDPPGDKL